MQTPKSPRGQDVVAIVRHVCEVRARQRLIPLRRRLITVKKVKDDFRINRHEIFIDWVYATTGNPITMIDRVLDAVVEFDRREFEERVRQLNVVKSEVMRLTAYLERSLSKAEYQQFMFSLIPEEEIIVPVEALAPDHDDLNLAYLLTLEGEHMVEALGIYFNA